MRHARPDYNRFQDPVTVLRAAAKEETPDDWDMIGTWTSGPEGKLIAPNGRTYFVREGPTFVRSVAADGLVDVMARLLTALPGTRGIPEDEPVFLVRGQDKAGPGTVLNWARLASIEKAEPDIVETANGWVDEMFEWQKKHLCKIPDLTHPGRQPILVTATGPIDPGRLIAVLRDLDKKKWFHFVTEKEVKPSEMPTFTVMLIDRPLRNAPFPRDTDFRLVANPGPDGDRDGEEFWLARGQVVMDWLLSFGWSER